MNQEIVFKTCGLKHQCDDKGEFIVGYSDGTEIPETKAKEREDWPRGITYGSVSCSQCGNSEIQTSMWLN